MTQTEHHRACVPARAGLTRAWLLALVAAASLAGSALHSSAVDSAAPAQAAAWALVEHAPALPSAEATCPVAPELGARRARSAHTAALAAIDRYPFDAREGLHALALLAQAAHCAAGAGPGDDALAAAASARSQTWRERLERDYRDHLTRYRLAIAGDRPLRALAELDALIALRGAPGDNLAGNVVDAFAVRLRHARDALAARGDAERSP